MDLDKLRLRALIQHAEKIPEDALPHLGALAHLGLWLSGESRRRFYNGVAAIFGYGAADHKKGIKQILRIRELDHEMRVDAARDANRLRSRVSLPERGSVRTFFRALRGASVLRGSRGRRSL